MSYTLIHNWGWFKHEDCRNAYSVHADTCRIAQNADIKQRQNKIQYFETGFASVEHAIAGARADAECRFRDTLQEYGFKQMFKVCQCAKSEKLSQR